MPQRSPAADEGQLLIQLRGVGLWYKLRKKQSFKRLIKESLGLKRQREQHKDRFWALRGLDLECREGQVVGIVGHNGAGKSTLCMLLTRILSPDEGTAEIHGHVTPLLSLGAGFNIEMSGLENIFIYAAFLGIPRAHITAKIDEIVEFSELGQFIHQPVYTYSSGMRARLGFSIAASLRPEIMILDEILGVGDREFQARSRERILEMMGESKLILIVSHSTSKLRELCTHCLWMEHGRKRMYGTTEEVLAAYEQTADSGRLKTPTREAQRTTASLER